MDWQVQAQVDLNERRAWVSRWRGVDVVRQAGKCHCSTRRPLPTKYFARYGGLAMLCTSSHYPVRNSMVSSGAEEAYILSASVHPKHRQSSNRAGSCAWENGLSSHAQSTTPTCWGARPCVYIYRIWTLAPSSIHPPTPCLALRTPQTLPGRYERPSVLSSRCTSYLRMRCGLRTPVGLPAGITHLPLQSLGISSLQGTAGRRVIGCASALEPEGLGFPLASQGVSFDACCSSL